MLVTKLGNIIFAPVTFVRGTLKYKSEYYVVLMAKEISSSISSSVCIIVSQYLTENQHVPGVG